MTPSSRIVLAWSVIVWSILTATIAGCETTGPTAAEGAASSPGPIEWRLQSAYGDRIPVVGEGGRRLADEITRRSGGDLTVEFLQPGDVVRASEVHRAVARGKLDAGWTVGGYNVLEAPAMAVFTGVPFGPGGLGQYEWLRSGDGRALYDELHEKVGLKAKPCGYIGAEAGGWFIRPVRRPEDLDGMRVRVFGLGARVMQRLGVKTQLLAGGDVKPALERRVIDGAEFSVPYIDLRYGFYEVADHYYYPGWHQLASVIDLVVNPASWEALSQAQRTLVEQVCEENVRWSFERDEALRREALAELRAKPGISVQRFDPTVVRAAYRAWNEVADGEAAADRDFARVLASYRRFLVDNPSPVLADE